MVTQQAPPAEAVDRNRFDLGQLEVGGRRSRLPEVALGLLLIVGSALGALAWQTFNDSSRFVMAARREIPRGQQLTLDDLQSVEVATDEPLNLTGDGELESLLGQVARIDIGAGTLMTADLVGAAPELEPGRAEVGVSLDLGVVPPRVLSPGAVVDVVLVPLGSAADVDLFDVDEAVLVARAVVADAVNDGSTVRLSLSVDDGDGTRIVRAAALNRIRVVAVSPDRSAPADAEAEGSIDTQTATEVDSDEPAAGQVDSGDNP